MEAILENYSQQPSLDEFELSEVKELLDLQVQAKIKEKQEMVRSSLQKLSKKYKEGKNEYLLHYKFLTDLYAIAIERKTLAMADERLSFLIANKNSLEELTLMIKNMAENLNAEYLQPDVVDQFKIALKVIKDDPNFENLQKHAALISNLTDSIKYCNTTIANNLQKSDELSKILLEIWMKISQD